MAYYLTSDGIDDYIQLDRPVDIPVGVPYRVEIDFQAIDGGDFGVRLSGNIGGNSNRIIVWKGTAPNAQGPVSLIPTTGSSANILNRSKWAWYRLDAINNRLSVDGVVMPTTVQNSGNASFSVLLTELSATNSRNPVNLYSYKVFVNDVLIHHWDPSASNGIGTKLFDVVGGNHGTLINYSGAANSQWVYYFDPVIDVNSPHIKCITNGKYYPNLNAIGSDGLNSNANTNTPLVFEVYGRHTGAFGFPSYYNSINPSYLIFKAAPGQEFDGKNGATCAAIIRNDTSGLYSSATSSSRLRLEGLRLEAFTPNNIIQLNPDRFGQIIEIDKCLIVGANSGVNNYALYAVGSNTTNKSRIDATATVITNVGASAATVDTSKATVNITNCLAIDTGKAGQTTRGGIANSVVIRTLSVMSNVAFNVSGLQSGSVSVATQDASGSTVNLRNLVVADHIKDYANGDYRIKNTSSLYAVNIGAFFEEPIDTPVTYSQIKVWNGVQFVDKPVKRWDGTNWVPVIIKRWNNTSWETV